MKRKALVVLGVLLLSFSKSFSAPSASWDMSEHTPVNAAVRSAVVPGWGQYFNGQETKGYAVIGGFVLTALTSYLLYTKANNTYDDYEKLGVKNGSLYSDYETQSNQAMTASLLAAGVWIYGIVDAYVVSNRASVDPYAKSDGLKLVSSRDNDLQLVFNKRF